MPTKTVTDDSFLSDVIRADQPVLVDFWAEWCGPCKMIAPALDQLSDELAGQVTIAKANLDDASEAASKYGVQSIPLLVLFKQGEEVARWTKGAAPKSALQSWLQGQL